jgi:hypothetical protein
MFLMKSNAAVGTGADSSKVVPNSGIFAIYFDFSPKENQGEYGQASEVAG